MYRILKKKKLNPTVTLLEIESPLVAKKAKAGQFIILRVDENGERIPLTVSHTDPEKGSVSIIFQIAGKTTFLLDRKEEGEYIEDFAGPLGNPTDIEGVKKALVVGGGVGCAIALPIAEALKKAGAEVTSVVGFRSKELFILGEEFKKCSDRFIVMTDDGSLGEKGFVTEPVADMLKNGEKFDKIIVIGPVVMMKNVVGTVRPYGIPCVVSMNPIMIDGTGMCGGCRLSVVENGERKIRFACVDGPDFDGYTVDFDELSLRNGTYAEFERKKYSETCNLFKKEVSE